MAFTYEITGQTYFGNKKIVFGNYVSTATTTGGDIKTGLSNCEAMFLQGKGTAVDAASPVVNETLPVAGGVVTIVTTAAKSGSFMAVGY